MDFPLILVIGLPLALGVMWQARVISKDDWDVSPPKRVVAAWVASLVILLGVIGFYTIAAFDEQRTFSAYDIIRNLAKAYVLCMFLVVKSYLGPLITAYIMASVAYYGYEYGRFDYIPLVSAVLNWVFSNTGYYLQMTYLVISTILISASSLWDTLDHH